jgi:hypothetical protein
MTRTPDTTNPAEQLADLAALHCVELDGEDLACLGMRWADRPRDDIFNRGFDYEGYLAALRAAGQSQTAPTPPARARRQRTPRQPTPDGLKPPAQAAARLGCSIKTLNGHIATGALGYVIIGHGRKRPRKMFTDADLDAFIANQTRKDVPCPSIATRAPRSGNTTSRGEVIAFSAQPKPRPGAKPKR